MYPLFVWILAFPSRPLIDASATYQKDISARSTTLKVGVPEKDMSQRVMDAEVDSEPDVYDEDNDSFPPISGRWPMQAAQQGVDIVESGRKFGFSPKEGARVLTGVGKIFKKDQDKADQFANIFKNHEIDEMLKLEEAHARQEATENGCIERTRYGAGTITQSCSGVPTPLPRCSKSFQGERRECEEYRSGKQGHEKPHESVLPAGEEPILERAEKGVSSKEPPSKASER